MMATWRKRFSGGAPVTGATEPRCYDRSFYARVLVFCFIVILLGLGFFVYNNSFKKKAVTSATAFDFRSLLPGHWNSPPDPENPCIVLQAHIEATRQCSYEAAYGFLCSGLKKEVPLEEFRANAEANELLFRNIRRYVFPRYRVDGTAAAVEGHLEYGDGGRSRVEAAFAREGDSWRISQMMTHCEYPSRKQDCRLSRSPPPRTCTRCHFR